MTDSELALLRQIFARHVYFASGADDPRLEACLAEVRREDFLGPGPWDIASSRTPGQYWRTPDAEPHWLYQDGLVALMPEKQLNNGHVSFVTYLISLGRTQAGEHAVHIGAGVGYYTAFLARLVGESGKVTAIEYEPELAKRASANLGAFPQVAALEGDGSTLALEPADVIFVNAGATHPLPHWLDGLKDGGRLIVPLTASDASQRLGGWGGRVFVIERHGESYSAEAKAQVAIYPCFGARDPKSEALLAAAFRRRGVEKVRRLYRTDDVDPDNCWAKGPGWALAYS
jgi:protein-L-isoaspartate(D-aspartate) O-methyltransferase